MEINITILDIIINQQIFLYSDVHIFIIIKSEFFYNWFPETSTHFPVQNYQLINYQFIVMKKLKTGTISIIESLCI